MVSLLKCCGVFITVIAIFVGLLISGVLRQAGLFKLINPSLPDMLTGMVPALMDGIEWTYTYDDVAKVDLTGQIALVTGANAGIGRSLSAHLAKQNVISSLSRILVSLPIKVRCNHATQKHTSSSWPRKQTALLLRIYTLML